MKKIFFLTEKNEKDAIAFSIMSPRYIYIFNYISAVYESSMNFALHLPKKKLYESSM